MLNDRENILNALREKPLKVYEIMKRADVVNEEACQSLIENARRRIGEVRYSQRAMAYRMIRNWCEPSVAVIASQAVHSGSLSKAFIAVAALNSTVHIRGEAAFVHCHLL
jgi:hypothetical protein